MIKLMASEEGVPLFGFGLSENNIKELKKGRPIRIDLKSMGAHGTVLIFYGKTEADMEKDLEPMMNPKTKVNRDDIGS